MFTVAQLEMDIRFLARRAGNAGAFICSEDRDWGISSNSLVDVAYGVGKQIMPSDWSDYAACVRAVRHLPRHRRTKMILHALRRARRCVERRYPKQKLAA